MAATLVRESPLLRGSVGLLLEVRDEVESEFVNVLEAWSGVVVVGGVAVGRVFTTNVVDSGGGTLEVVAADFVGLALVGAGRFAVGAWPFAFEHIEHEGAEPGKPVDPVGELSERFDCLVVEPE